MSDPYDLYAQQDEERRREALAEHERKLGADPDYREWFENHEHKWTHRPDGDTAKVKFYECSVTGCTEPGYEEKT